MAKTATEINPVSNDGAESIGYQETYTALVKIEGTAPILFHRWSVEGVAEKAAAAKGSKAKKSDDINSYVYRCDNGHIGIPSEYLRMAIINAAKFRQDPRSPRKSAMDLFKAGLVCLTEMADTGEETWDFIDQRRVTIQRNGITRSRPALKAGWAAEFEIAVLVPEYITSVVLLDTINQAGRLVGLADFRPTYGRFVVKHFEVMSA